MGVFDSCCISVMIVEELMLFERNVFRGIFDIICWFTVLRSSVLSAFIALAGCVKGWILWFVVIFAPD